MPILTLQRRHVEKGRIRLGEQRVSAKGKRYPAGLTTFRLTSADRPVLEAASHLYGGEVTAWDSPAGPQWQITTEASALSVLVLGEDYFSQWNEVWDAGGIRKRCDGQENVVAGEPCSCDPDNPECVPTTRLSVLLPELVGIGTWRVEARGWNAAAELPSAVELLRAAAQRGSFIPARLRIESRSVKRLDEEGKVRTQNFVVPVLDIDCTLQELLPALQGAVRPVLALPGATGPGNGQLGGGRPTAGDPPELVHEAEVRTEHVGGASPDSALRADVRSGTDDERAAAPEHAERGGQRPTAGSPAIPPEHQPPVPSLEAQLAGTDDLTAGSTLVPLARPNLPLRPAGLAPERTPTAPGVRGPMSAGEGRAETASASTAPPADDQAQDAPPGDRLHRKLMAAARDTFPDMTVEDRQQLRYVVTAVITGAARTSSKQLDDDERGRAIDLLRMIREGAVSLTQQGPAHWRLDTGRRVAEVRRDDVGVFSVITHDRGEDPF